MNISDLEYYLNLYITEDYTKKYNLHVPMILSDDFSSTHDSLEMIDIRYNKEFNYIENISIGMNHINKNKLVKFLSADMLKCINNLEQKEKSHFSKLINGYINFPLCNEFNDIIKDCHKIKNGFMYLFPLEKKYKYWKPFNILSTKSELYEDYRYTNHLDFHIPIGIINENIKDINQFVFDIYIMSGGSLNNL